MLDWRALKPFVFGLIPNSDIKMELVSAFLLSTQLPFKYNILFVDDLFVKEYSRQVMQIQPQWDAYKSENNLKEGVALSVSQNNLEDFVKTENVQKVLTDLGKAFYWEEGRYKIEMLVHLSNPNRVHKALFEFSISKEQLDLLKSNCLKIIHLLCGEKVYFEHVFSEYKMIS